eukprot:XP_001702230.1 predicted protein [Chlamydomonas reinhardtii]
MVVASFTEPAQQHRAPFPLIPTGVHIATMLAAAYPHFDIVDEKFVFRTSPETFADSLRYTTLGCVLLAAGHYACQFVAALRPLRHEYLGTMALLQVRQVRPPYLPGGGGGLGGGAAGQAAQRQAYRG